MPEPSSQGYSKLPGGLQLTVLYQPLEAGSVDGCAKSAKSTTSQSEHSAGSIGASHCMDGCRNSDWPATQQPSTQGEYDLLAHNPKPQPNDTLGPKLQEDLKLVKSEVAGVAPSQPQSAAIVTEFFSPALSSRVVSRFGWGSGSSGFGFFFGVAACISLV